MFKPKEAELLLTHNVYGDNIDIWAEQYEQQFEMWETKQSKSNEVHHEIVSFSVHENKDNLTRELLLDVAHKMVELLGDDAMHTIVVHRDKNHWHLHDCCSTSSILTLMAIRLEGRQFLGIRKELDRHIQRKYPSIEFSFPYITERTLEPGLKETNGDYRTKKS